MRNDFYSKVFKIDELAREYSPENFTALREYLDNNAVLFDYFIKKISIIPNSKWLIPLKEAGYFNPGIYNPKPEKDPNQPEYTIIPYWSALSYLKIISKENKDKPNKVITKTLLDIVNEITNYRDEKNNHIDNFQTGWELLTILSNLPIDLITNEHIEFICDSLRSDYSSSLVISDLGKIFIPKLIEGRADKLLLSLLEVLLEYNNPVNEYSEYTSITDKYWLFEALKKNKPGIAKLCGIDAARIAVGKIKKISGDNENRFYPTWISTIEDHKQTPLPDRYECQLVHFVRDMYELCPYSPATKTDVTSLLEGNLPILKRIAIHVINRHYDHLKDLFWEYKGNPLNEVLLKHELYVLLENHCKEFNSDEINKVIDWIETKEFSVSEDIEDDPRKTKEYEAQYKKEWLTALIGSGNKEVREKYDHYDKINSYKIKHPGHSSWQSSVDWVGEESPITVEEFSKKSNQGIAEYLIDFKDEGKHDWDKLTEVSLTGTLQNAVTAYPEKFSSDLKPFLSVQPIYILRLLWGLTEVWRNKNHFEWDELFEFIGSWTKPPTVLQVEDDEKKKGDRSSIIRAIADLITEGTRNDKHAFKAKLLPKAEEILLCLLNTTESDVTPGVDIVTSTLNSTKGSIYTALVNYSLRYARLSISNDKEEHRWKETIKNEFTRRLDRKVEPSHEYSAILGQYIANLYYLDKDWVKVYIKQIFPIDDSAHSKASIGAYLYYSNTVYKEIYDLLKTNEIYEYAISTRFDDNFAAEKLIQNICIGYLEEWEELDDELSLTSILLEKADPNHLRELASFMWTFREKLDDSKKIRVKLLWQKLMSEISEKLNKPEYRSLASKLGEWLILVDEIDDDVEKWMKKLAQNVDKDRYSRHFITEYLLQHCEKTPRKVGSIFIEMLENGIFPLYEEEHIQELVRKLYTSKNQVMADQICNMYGAKGYIEILKDVYMEHYTE